MAADSGTLRLQFKTKDVSRAIKRLKGRAKPAIVRALNRSALATKTFMIRKVAQDLGLKVGDVKSGMKTRDANLNRLTAAVIATGAPISLIKFRAKGPVPSLGRGKGVTARLPAPGKGKYPHAFIATVRHGQTNEHTAVFERKGKTRLPLKKLHGPSVAHVFDKYRDAGLMVSEDTLLKNLKHELKFALSQS
ncbi:MAG: phage tail protein [Acidobacteriota bacterium]|nr:phage tail protein [Acidobacteriota bacterium]